MGNGLWVSLKLERAPCKISEFPNIKSKMALRELTEGPLGQNGPLRRGPKESPWPNGPSLWIGHHRRRNGGWVPWHRAPLEFEILTFTLWALHGKNESKSGQKSAVPPPPLSGNVAPLVSATGLRCSGWRLATRSVGRHIPLIVLLD